MILSAGCSDLEVSSPPTNSQQAIDALSGCYDPTDTQCSNTPPTGDPNPGASGVYLGSNYTPAVCMGAYINDADSDDFSDDCEFQLTLAFRPLLSTNPYDNDLRRQSYWAATFEPSAGYVTLMYLFAYNFDNGNSHASVCQGSSFGYCKGHFGDSEYVQIRIDYNATTKHWYLVNATTSAHWLESCPWLPGTHCDYTTMHIGDNLEYPTKELHYPRIYVARDKHANYNKRSECDSGGAYNSDDCEFNVDNGRFAINRYKNVGQTWDPMITSTTHETNPIVFSGVEYFSNSYQFTPFCGWDGVSVNNRSNCSVGYEYVLYYYYF